MPKEKPTKACRLSKFVKEIGGGVLKTDGKILLCTLCDKKVGSDSKFQVEQHIKTKLHEERLKKNNNRQELIIDSVDSSKRKSEFSFKLCEALISADIPFWKLENPTFRKFLETYTGKTVPHESTLRKTYLPTAFDNIMERIRQTTFKKKLWISIDETTDVMGRYVANVIIGILDEANFEEKPFLVNVKQLEKTNSTTIAQCFDESITILGPNISKDDVLLFLSDAAPYMIKAGKGLKLIYPNMIHVTCIVHGLHNVAEAIRDQFPNINKLIANVKRVFLKAPSRVQIFRHIAECVPLPPEPVLTRWGTWLEAAVYYCRHFEKIKEVFNNLNETEAIAILEAKKLLQDPQVRNDLIFIASNFEFLPEMIKKLEGRLLLSQSLKILHDIESRIMSEEQPNSKVKSKFSSIFFEKNFDLKLLKKVNQILSGVTDVALDIPSDLIKFYKYAPLTSVEVERSFSKYKSLLTDRRQSFTFDNLRMNFTVHWNT